MPRINMAGASGLPPNIVEQLMAAERAPIKGMETKKTDIEAKLSLVNDFEGRVLQLKDGLKSLTGVGGFQDYALSMSKEGVLAGSVDPSQARTGSWAIEVTELPEAAGAMTNGFPDKDQTKLGVGYLKFETKDGTKEVYINDKNNTLSGLANAVNNSGLGVRASVIKDADSSDEPYKVIFSGEGFGDGNTMDFPSVYLLDGDQDFYFDREKVAKNGKMKINGFEIEVDEKKLAELIPGVTLDLQSASPGKEVVVSVAENFEVIEGKIGEFVTAVNGVLGFIQTQNKMDENTDTKKTLGGDSMVRSVEGRMRRLIQSGSYTKKEGEINRLADLGVEYNRSGTVDFKQDKFDAALRANPQGVLKFLKGDGSRGSGFVGKVNSFVNEVTQSFGVISNKKQGLASRTQRIDRNIENKERMLARKEQSLRRQFSRMEETIGRLKGQGNAIGQIGA